MTEELLDAGPSYEEETILRLRADLRNAHERLAEATTEAWVHRQNWERAIQVLAVVAPPDITALLHDELMTAWIDSVK